MPQNPDFAMNRKVENFSWNLYPVFLVYFHTLFHWNFGNQPIKLVLSDHVNKLTDKHFHP